MKRAALTLLASAACGFTTAEGGAPRSSITIATLVQSTSSWDGAPYDAYPSGQPQITVLKFTIAPHTVMTWHSHPMPSAAFIVFYPGTPGLSISMPQQPGSREQEVGQ